MANQLKMALIEAIVSLKARGWSNRRIARELGVDRDTVSRQLRSNAAKAPIGSTATPPQANAAKALTGSAEAASASCGSTRSACEPFRDLILAKLDEGLTAQRIYQDLVSDHHFPSKYYSVCRFVRQLSQGSVLPFRRKRRHTHVFRIVLSHSRKGYSEAVYHQSTEEFLNCLENAFWSWGGVPKTLVLDNLKAGVEVPDWYDPELNPKLRSFAEHYGLAVLPTRPRMPRHKGKTEAAVKYVKGNALKGRVFGTLQEENDHLRHWEQTVADVRLHGTTRQQVAKVFAEVERPALLPLAVGRFPFFHEGRRSVNRDGHVEVAKAYYSAPPEYLGRRLWVRWDSRLVRLFNERFEQIAVHVRQPPGKFSTQERHIVAEKISNVERGAAWLLSKVRGHLGPSSARWAEGMMAARGIEGVRVLQGLWSLGQRHPSESLEKACETAASYGAFRLRTIRALLKREAPKQPALFEFTAEHPLIRSLDDYAQVVHDAVQKEITR
jgi:transposase